MRSPIENWRPVPDFEGLYDVSDHGRVKRVGRAARHGKSHGGGARIGRIIALCPQPKGYIQVNLWKEGKIKRKLVHVLVATAFIGPVPDGKEVNHKDGIKAHCWLDNLEYLTRSENEKHAYRTGLCRPVNLKLTAEQVREIRMSPLGCRRLARQYGVSKHCIQAVMTNRTWRVEWQPTNNSCE